MEEPSSSWPFDEPVPVNPERPWNEDPQSQGEVRQRTGVFRWRARQGARIANNQKTEECPKRNPANLVSWASTFAVDQDARREKHDFERQCERHRAPRTQST